MHPFGTGGTYFSAECVAIALFCWTTEGQHSRMIYPGLILLEMPRSNIHFKRKQIKSPSFSCHPALGYDQVGNVAHQCYSSNTPP